MKGSKKLASSREPQLFILADTTVRIQRLEFYEYLPYRKDGKCRCGCGKKLPPRRPVWYSRYHANMAVNKWRISIGDPAAVRNAIYARDKGVCFSCDAYDYKWEAHHVIPVILGGGYCTLDNYKTLCKACHNKETKLLRKALAKYGKELLCSRYVHMASIPIKKLTKG